MLEIKLESGGVAFMPGDTLRGSVEWMEDEGPDAVEVRLIWYTEGRGDQDVGIARTLRIEHPSATGSANFEFEAPGGPYSCSGRLISIRWAVEAVTRPGKLTARSEIVLAPEGREVELAATGS